MKRSLFLGVGGLLLAFAAVPLVRAADKPLATGAAAPGFSLVDHTGKTIKLSDYADKVVVLEWTNPECPFVQRHYQAKTMTTLADQYKAKGVVWLAVNSTGMATNAKDAAWATAQGISYPILNDAAGTVGHAYGAKTTPHMFVIDKGKVVYAGGIDNDPDGEKDDRINYVKQTLDEVLAGKPVSNASSRTYGCAVHYAK